MIKGANSNMARLAALLVRGDSCSDYDLWRALKTIGNELYRLERLRLPVPIEILYARRILRDARLRRRAGTS